MRGYNNNHFSRIHSKSAIFTLQIRARYKESQGYRQGWLGSGPNTSNTCTEDSAIYVFITGAGVSTVVIISSRTLSTAIEPGSVRLGGKFRPTRSPRNHIHIWIHSRWSASCISSERQWRVQNGTQINSARHSAVHSGRQKRTTERVDTWCYVS